MCSTAAAVATTTKGNKKTTMTSLPTSTSTATATSERQQPNDMPISNQSARTLTTRTSSLASLSASPFSNVRHAKTICTVNERWQQWRLVHTLQSSSNALLSIILFLNVCEVPSIIFYLFSTYCPCPFISCHSLTLLIPIGSDIPGQSWRVSHVPYSNCIFAIRSSKRSSAYAAK